MRTGLEMGECLTSCVVAHVLNWEGVVVMAETYVPTTNAWHVSRPMVTAASSCMKSIFMKRRCVISPCHGNSSIEFIEIDEFHKVTVRNPSLLFQLFQKRSMSPFIQGSYIGSLAMAAADDIIIAIAMVYLLRSQRTGVKRYWRLKIGGVLDIYHVICQHKLHSGQDHNIFHQYRTINQVRFNPRLYVVHLISR